MPLSNNPNEEKVFKYLTTTGGFNLAVTCGILTNIFLESSFNSDQNNGNGTWDVNGYSYGLCQWHDVGNSGGRFTKLKNYCKSRGTNYRSVDGQLDFLMYELKNSYSTLFSMLNSCSNNSSGTYTASSQFCARYLVPAGYGSWNNGVLTLGTTSKFRGDKSKNETYPMYIKNTPKVATGDDIVETAKSKLGSSYASASYGPNKFSSSGFTYYCYNNNDITIPKTAAEQIELSGITVNSNFKAGDMLFFKGESRSSSNAVVYSAIATGKSNEFIGCMGYSPYMSVSTMSLDKDDLWKSKFISGLRILDKSSSTATDSGYNGYVSPSDTYSSLGSSISSINISNRDNYLDNLVSAISYIETEGNSYCSLTSLRDGSIFKFFIENGASENFPVSYSSPGNIIGRSVPVLGYDSTGARTVAISLDLFAGEMYRPDIDIKDPDPIGTLHSDLDLLKSFEYPDYSSSIVVPPPMVLLSLGSTLKIKGVLQGLSIEYLRPYDSKSRAMHASVSFTVTQVSNDPPDYLDIRNRTNKSY